MRVHCDLLGRAVELPDHPQRIVSLVSSATEIVAALGHTDRLAGVSSYCGRYVDGLKAPIVGNYVDVDEGAIRDARPDLVLTTTGVQRWVGKRLADEGLPVYVLPLPNSVYGILEGVRLVGALVDDMPAAHGLCATMEAGFTDLRNRTSACRPRVYSELWLGRHVRTPGGLTYIHDLLTLAGGDPIFGSDRSGYLPVDAAEVERLRPDIAVIFSEPEYPIDSRRLLADRGWDRSLPGLTVVESSVERGRNLIHDGPSILDTARWLHDAFAQVWGR
jgi:ABC-type Fe3+-hydroxamate transport system substrate-binding protein